MKFRSNIRDLSKDAIDDFLKKSRVGVLSLTDGKLPYGIPLAYFFENNTIYLTLGPTGRKMEYIKENKNVSFAVFQISEEFGRPGKTDWTSVICDGLLENITDPEELTKVVRAGERNMGMPEGTWENLLRATLKDPEKSNFWKIRITTAGGRGVENEELEFEE